MTTRLTIRRPDDWHLHLRDGEMLKAVLPESARHFGRAIIMPNLVPPVVTAADAADYRDRIMWAKPRGTAFKPLMTLYLTEATEVRDIRAAHEIGLIHAVKLYPAGATTNSPASKTSPRRTPPRFRWLRRFSAANTIKASPRKRNTVISERGAS